MLPAVRERLDYLGAEYERLVAENSRLQHLLKQSEFPSLDSPGSPSPDVQNKFTAVKNEEVLLPKEAWIQTQHVRQPAEFGSKDIVCDEVETAVAASVLQREDSFLAKDGTSSKPVLQAFPITPVPGVSESKTPRDTSRAGDDQEEPVSQLIFLDVIPAIIISINAAVVGLSADICPQHTVWVILEMFFTLFFTLEVLVKMKVFSIRGYFCGADWYWSWFDLFLRWAGLLGDVYEPPVFWLWYHRL